jgi:SHS2 domain-containing protein
MANERNVNRTIRDTGDDGGRDALLAEGVRALDHTADVGIDVEAPSLEALFERAGHGLIALLRGADRASGSLPSPSSDPCAATHASSTGAVETRRIVVAAPDAAALLVGWLRELLWLHESTAFAAAGVHFEALTPTALAADVRGAPDRLTPAREIKGVTYHGLDVRRTDDGWHARVIFDV